MVMCPKCRKEFSTNGLYGHLKYKHQLEGEDLEKLHRETVAEHVGPAGVKENEERNLLERVSTLHDELVEVRQRRADAEQMDKSGFWNGDDEPAKQLQQLYEREEERIRKQLHKLVHDPAEESEVFAAPVSVERKQQKQLTAAAVAEPERPWDEP